jgi:probable HAF family extracellular repeat protein/T5SS/PEP-CTERM-associated repeat protein
VAAAVACIVAKVSNATTLTYFGSQTYSILDEVYRTTSGTSSSSFQQTFSVSRFDPALGSLVAAEVTLTLSGQVEIGVFPHGPYFLPGSGTVNGSATLSLAMNLPTSIPLSLSQTIGGSQVGSIAGPPGAGSTDTLNLDFSRIVIQSYGDPDDLKLFTGLTTFSFPSQLDLATSVSVSQSGPNFGIEAGGPFVTIQATVKYSYIPVPEPNSLFLFGLVVTPFTACWVARKSKSGNRATPGMPRQTPQIRSARHFAVGIVTLVAFVCPGNTSARAGNPPAIYNLGDLGGSYSVGYGVNDSGQVVGWSYTSSYAQHAFLYTGTPGSGGKMMDLGTLGGRDSMAFGINASGTVVGESYIPDGVPFGPYDVYHAFEYIGTPGTGGAMLDLGTLGGGLSTARGINASGQVVGRAESSPLNADSAFLYTGTPGAGGTMTDLGTLGLPSASASAINRSGQVVGWSDVANGSHAFLYTPSPAGGGTMADLGSLGGDGGASAINDNGLVAGTSGNAGNAARHAFLYTGTPGSGGKMTDLGTLGGTESFALGINSTGQVVGYSQTLYDVSTLAFLYTGVPGSGGRMIDLNVWLNINNPIEGAKWTLKTAEAITDTGLITGDGVYNDGPGGLSDGERAYLLDVSSLLVPEPTSLVLLGTGAVGLLLWQARKRSPGKPRLIARLNTGLLLVLWASSAPAAITVTGSTSPTYDDTDPWVTSSLVVGTSAGPGGIAIGAGSVIHNTANSVIGIFLAASPSSVTVDGTGANWTNTGELDIGRSGVATLTISGGGSVSDVIGSVAPNANVTVGGGTGSSTWTNGSLRIHGNGSTSLTIVGGGAVSDGTAMVNGLGAVSVGGGVGNSTWANSSSLTMGDATVGTCTLTITGGGTVTDSAAYVGATSGIGAAAVYVGGGVGPAVWSNSSSLSIGAVRGGAVTVTGGGSVLVGSGLAGYGLTVGNFGLGGTLTVKDGGSVSCNGNATIGGNGNGTLSITGGGSMSDALAYVGYMDGIGMVSVGGGPGTSVWSNTGNLLIGSTYAGRSSVTVTSGGTVLAAGVLVGGGTLTIADGGSVSCIGTNVGSGSSGGGVLTITRGGSLTETGAIINGNGATVIVGGGPGMSIWSNLSDVRIGSGSTTVGSGGGTLTITGGGSVVVGRNLMIEVDPLGTSTPLRLPAVAPSHAAAPQPSTTLRRTA